MWLLPPWEGAGVPEAPSSALACSHARLLNQRVELSATNASTAGHESWVLSVSAHPSGAAFATGSSDSKVCVVGGLLATAVVARCIICPAPQCVCLLLTLNCACLKQSNRSRQ